MGAGVFVSVAVRTAGADTETEAMAVATRHSDLDARLMIGGRSADDIPSGSRVCAACARMLGPDEKWSDGYTVTQTQLANGTVVESGVCMVCARDFALYGTD